VKTKKKRDDDIFVCHARGTVYKAWPLTLIVIFFGATRHNVPFSIDNKLPN
jgi:hypothetical protein